MAAEPPRKDGGKLLLDKPFLDACSTLYAVIPGGHENQGQTFVSKYLNVVDPLRTSNNLGRSVSKGNFYRIRSAFGFGAKKLAKILECPTEKIICQIDQFFMNTWERHGSGKRPDVPIIDVQHLQLTRQSSTKSLICIEGNSKPANGVENSSVKSVGQGQLKNPSSSNTREDSGKCKQGIQNMTSTGLSEYPSEKKDLHRPVSHELLPNKVAISSNSKGSNESEDNKSHHQNSGFSSSVPIQPHNHANESGSLSKNGKGNKIDSCIWNPEENTVSRFSRAYSSPELTNVNNDNPIRGRRIRADVVEAFRNQVASLRSNHSALDRRRNMSSDSSVSSTAKVAAGNEYVSLKVNNSSEICETENATKASSNTSGTITNGRCFDTPFQGEQETQADEWTDTCGLPDGQDPVEGSKPHIMKRENPHVHLPVDFTSVPLPVPQAPSLLASVFAPTNLPSMVHPNTPLPDSPWGLTGHSSYATMEFPQPLVAPVSPWMRNSDLMGSSNYGETGPTSENAGGLESPQKEEHHGPNSWSDQDEEALHRAQVASDFKGVRSFHHILDEQQLFTHEWPSSPSGNHSLKTHTKLTKDGRGQLSEQRVKRFEESRVEPGSKEACKTEAGTLKTVESHWNGPSVRGSKFSRERRSKGRGHGNIECSHSRARETGDSNEMKATGVWQSETNRDGSFAGDEMSNQDAHSFGTCNSASNHGNHHSSFVATGKSSMSYSSSVSTTIPPILPSTIPTYEQPTVTPTGNLSPVLVNQTLRQGEKDNVAVPPFAFYPTGPPLPFFMFPLSYIPTDGTSSGDLSNSFETTNSPDDIIDSQPDQSLDDSDYDFRENSEQSENFCSTSMRTTETSCMDNHDRMKSDILQSDFDSHWLNLQYGRLCQNPCIPGHVFYPSPTAIPPTYLQGHYPWDGLGRPLSANMNMLTQLVSGGHRFLPVMTLQPNSNRPINSFQSLGGSNRVYMEELPRYRGGTGTYLPNRRQVPYRDRQLIGSRGNRSNFSPHHNEHGYRDAGGLMFSRSKGSGRGQSRNDHRYQPERSNSRIDRVSEGKGKQGVWESYRNDNSRRASHQAQHRSLTSRNASANVGNIRPHVSSGMAYGLNPLQSMNSFGNIASVPANGPSVPPVVMVYPYEHNLNLTTEPLEFGSFGPVQLPGAQEGRLNDNGIDIDLRYDERSYYECKHSVYQTNMSPGSSPADHPSTPKKY
eukprot:TRINITY_DN7197_c0_g1_i1.p1 TRINITY_DN7197_c0_g1~~TRINITY_DN7197_c0_g1_i1.p1  ORF type:complete len:1272 (+),score=266.88 TRINITY_DN7197_c0_g1_i1:209-3817(+)